MIISPLIAFVFAGLFSPGPNIIMLTASGARFGLRATWPHILGVAIGVGVIGAVCGLGVGALIVSLPRLQFSLQCISAAWILWMAYRLWQSRQRANEADNDHPMTFIEAALFQWVNPKIWAIALAASTGYSMGLSPMNEAFRLAVAMSSVNFFVCIFWTYSGALLSSLLNDEKRWNIFRNFMAILLALTAVLVFI